MSDTVIKVETLSKKYIIGRQQEVGYKTLRDVITNQARRTGQRLLHRFHGNGVGASPHQEEFWALKGVSFAVRQGEVVGIIGRNGAGKSTLLKILSRITEPTGGRVRIKGRVASLLEVGTGFHPELTGRENIFLNGAVLGMTRMEIKGKFDEIVAFAETEKFLDTPVKRYSSGMYVRLAFAVAAHLEPEILLVDEVLAVGDTAFQKKCLGKMDNVAKQGRTVFFVSHNMASVRRLCTSVILLSEGQLLDRSDPRTVIDRYMREGLRDAPAINLTENQHLVKSPLQIVEVTVLNAQERPSAVMCLGEQVSVRLTIRTSEPVAQARIGIGVYADGVRVCSTHAPPMDFRCDGGPQIVICRLPPNILLPNLYSLHVGAYSLETGRGLDWVADAIDFRVEHLHADGITEYDQRDDGLLKVNASWEFERFEAAAPALPDGTQI